MLSTENLMDLVRGSSMLCLKLRLSDRVLVIVIASKVALMHEVTEWVLSVARAAFAAGQAALPLYASRTSRHDHTQPQLFALLVLRQFLDTGYGGVVALAVEWSDCAMLTSWSAGRTPRRWLTPYRACSRIQVKGGVFRRPARADRAGSCPQPHRRQLWPRSMRSAWRRATSAPTSVCAGPGLRQRIRTHAPSRPCSTNAPGGM
jgi:hypothetical protein